MNVRVDLSGVNHKVDKVKGIVQYVVASQVQENSNFYIPFQEGTLKKSARLSSDNTQVSWNTPYARRIYYGETFNFSKDKNPYASPKWFEKAKAINHSWIDVAQKAVDKL